MVVVALPLHKLVCYGYHINWAKDLYSKHGFFICGVKAGNITVNVNKYKQKFVVVVVFWQKINNQSVLFFNFIQAFYSLVFCSMLPICLAVCLVCTTWIGLLPSPTTAGGL